ncbi:MAG: hypothetical protein WC268_04675 [Patescibacteria group bacterium]|jgi:hypothetical protein
MADNKYGKKLIAWQFPEHEDYERTRGWYIGAGIIGLLLLIYSVFTGNFLFAMIIIVTAVIIFLKATLGYKNLDFAIYERGLRVGEKFYDFKEIKDFYVIYEPPTVKNLYFDFHSWVQPRLQIPLQSKNPVRVREILLDYLTEDLDQENEPLSDAMGRMFKL